MSMKHGTTSRRKRQTHKTPRKRKPEAPIAVCGHGDSWVKTEEKIWPWLGNKGESEAWARPQGQRPDHIQ